MVQRKRTKVNYSSHTRRVNGRTVRVRGHMRKLIVQPRRAGRNARTAFKSSTKATRAFILLALALVEITLWLTLRTAGATFWILAILAAGLGTGAMAATGYKPRRS